MCNEVTNTGILYYKDGEDCTRQVAAKGILMVMGDADRLMDDTLGGCGDRDLNRFVDMHITVFDFFTDPDAREELLSCFMMDKGMVVCGKTGRILANKFGIASIEKGDKRAGTKLQAASAIAQEGFISTKCSEDMCMPEGDPWGAIQVFPGTKSYVLVPKVRRGEVQCSAV